VLLKDRIEVCSHGCASCGMEDTLRSRFADPNK
jgi:hypothetical protein